MPSIGKGAQLQIRGMWSAGPGDDQARFLADLRSLRDMAAIGYDELAARAHFPSDILKEAENGPLLPGLPILTAYVRACEGDVTEWEERWRRLASEVPEDPDLPVRPAGASPAAVAGARAGVGIAPPEVYDPERIRAALRGGHQRSGQGDRRTSGAGWDTPADPTIKTANGNDVADRWSPEPFDTAARPDPARSAEHTDQFHWLPDEGSDARLADQGRAGTGQAGDWWADNGKTGDGQVAAGGDIAPAEPTAGEWTPREPDRVLKPPERTDFWATQNTVPSADLFWATQNTVASADLQPPATAPHWAEGQDSTPTETMAASSAASAASWPTQQAATDPAPSLGYAAATPPGASAVSAGYTGSATTGSARTAAAKTTASERADQQKDRFFSVRLLVIIVIAALIGSALVMLLA